MASPGRGQGEDDPTPPTLASRKCPFAVRPIRWHAGSDVSYPRYLVLDAIGTVVYATLWVLVGYVIGERAVAFLTEDRRRYVFIVVVLVAFACVIGYRLWRRRVAGVPRIS